MIKLLKPCVLSLSAALGLSACMDGGSGSSRPPTQLSFQDVSAMRLYQRGSSRSFRDGGLVYKTVSATVSYHPSGAFSHDETKGNAAYFRVFVDTHLSDFPPTQALPSSVLQSLQKSELLALHNDLVAERTSDRIVELAKSAASHTICTTGSVKLDERPIREAKPLTASEQARANAALGGKPERVLGMTNKDLDRLGIGFVLNRETRAVPNLDYKTHKYSGQTSAVLRMKCVF